MNVKNSMVVMKQVQPLRISIGICVVLILAVWVVFDPAVQFDFSNFDDPGFVVDNSNVNSGITLDGVRWALANSHCGNWHPLTSFSHMLDCELFGLNAAGHHFTSLILHALNAVLLLWVVFQLTGKIWRSAAVAFLFAIHPLRVESVVWIAERKDVLSGLFFMLTLLAYACYARHTFSWRRYLIPLFCFLMGLLSKPMLVTLPAVLLLLDFWPLNRLGGHEGKSVPVWRLIAEKLPFFMFSIPACITAVWAQGNVLGKIDVPVFYRFANAVVSYGIYLKQTIWPTNLAVLYPHPGADLSIPVAAVCLLLLFGITVAAWVLRKKQPWLLTGWFWFVGMLVPVIGLVQVGVQAHADRYTYLAQIGLYLMFVWAVAENPIFRKQKVLGGLFCTCVIIFLMGMARSQVLVWESDLSLWSHALESNRNNPTAWNNLGTAFFEAGDAASAESCFREVLRNDPTDVDGVYNLGVIMVQQGRQDAGISLLEQALMLDSDRFETLKALGAALILQGRVQDGLTYSRRALQIHSEDETVFRNIEAAEKLLNKKQRENQ